MDALLRAPVHFNRTLVEWHGMATKEPDKVQREIEEILDKLDNFVPEERFISKVKQRRRDERRAQRTGPTLWERATRPFSRVTLGHMMLAGLALSIIAWLFGDALGAARTWVLIAGLGMTVVAFVLSAMNGGQSRTPVFGGRVQKQWRGKTIEYGGEPSAFSRVRSWFSRRGRP